MDNMGNIKIKDEDKKPNAPCGLVVIGDRARMREAAKTNPTLAKLLENRTISDEETMLREIEIGNAGPVETREVLEEWKVALRFEEGKGARGIHGEIDIVFVGPDDRSDLIPVFNFMKNEAAEPKETPSSRMYSHDIGGMSAAWLKALSNDDDEDKGAKGSSEASTEATSSGKEKKASHEPSTRAKGDKPESKGRLPKIPEPRQAKERSCFQAIHESGVTSMKLGNVDIKEVDTKGAQNTAEILKRAIDMDTIPTEPLTREHFGFSKCNDTDSEANLCGLYTGLLSSVYLSVTAKQIHEWQTDNKLAAGILEAYHPQTSGYLQWFERNLHLVDADYVRPGGLKAPPGQGERISENFWDH